MTGPTCATAHTGAPNATAPRARRSVRPALVGVALVAVGLAVTTAVVLTGGRRPVPGEAMALPLDMPFDVSFVDTVATNAAEALVRRAAGPLYSYDYRRPGAAKDAIDRYVTKDGRNDLEGSVTPQTAAQAARTRTTITAAAEAVGVADLTEGHADVRALLRVVLVSPARSAAHFLLLDVSLVPNGRGWLVAGARQRLTDPADEQLFGTSTFCATLAATDHVSPTGNRTPMSLAAQRGLAVREAQRAMRTLLAWDTTQPVRSAGSWAAVSTGALAAELSRTPNVGRDLNTLHGASTTAECVDVTLSSFDLDAGVATGLGVTYTSTAGSPTHPPVVAVFRLGRAAGAWKVSAMAVEPLG